MTIIEMLKSDDYFLMITVGDKWLCWQQDCWTVYQKKKYSKNSQIIIQTKYEEEAVSELLKG